MTEAKKNRIAGRGCGSVVDSGALELEVPGSRPVPLVLKKDLVKSIVRGIQKDNLG